MSVEAYIHVVSSRDSSIVAIIERSGLNIMFTANIDNFYNKTKCLVEIIGDDEEIDTDFYVRSEKHDDILMRYIATSVLYYQNAIDGIEGDEDELYHFDFWFEPEELHPNEQENVMEILRSLVASK